MTQVFRYKLFAVAILLASANNLFGQAYSIEPNDTIVANASINKLSHFSITQQSLITGKLVFSWEQIYLSVPIGWMANLCDNGHCYIDFPANGRMDTVYNSDYGLLSVAIDPGIIKGSAVIRYVVWEHNTPLQKDTLTWIINANGPTGTSDIINNQSFLVYPNPAEKIIQIVAPGKDGCAFNINDLDGKEMLCGELTEGTNSILTEHLPTGTYILSISLKCKVTKIQKLLIQH